MGRRSRNQGNIKNYFHNLGEHFFGTTKANEASDAITKEYEKQIADRTKKRDEERTQELSDFDTARSKAADAIRTQNQAGYDAAESARKTALQDADAKYQKADWTRNNDADIAVIQQRKQLLQDDFNNNGGIYYDLDDGGFKFRDAFGKEQSIPARNIPSNTPIVIVRHNNNNQLEVLDPTADNRIISNTLSVKPFNPHMGNQAENTADADNAKQLFSSYLSRNADTDLKAYGINPDEIRSNAIQSHQSTQDYTTAKNKAENDFNKNKSVKNYLGADDYVKNNGDYTETKRN